jgi:hypothetical protein
LKVPIAVACRDVVGSGVGYLAKRRTVEKKDLGIAIQVRTKRVFLGREGDARAVLRNARCGSARSGILKKYGRIAYNVGANRTKVVRASCVGNIFRGLEGDPTTVTAERRIDVYAFFCCVGDSPKTARL